MAHGKLIPFLALALIDCQGNSDQTISAHPDSIAVVADSLTSTRFTIFEFPTHWYMLSESEDSSGYILHQPCEADMQQITLEQQKNNAWGFVFNFGQETMTWKLQNFNASAIRSSSLDYVEGSFSLLPPISDEVIPDAVEFYWNRIENYCDFKGDVIGENRFVHEEKKSAYKRIEEDCAGLKER